MNTEITSRNSFADIPLSTWQAAAEKAIKGAPLSTLTRRTDEGIAVAPLYTAANSTITPQPARAEHANPWDIQVEIDCPTASHANTQAHEALMGGAHRLCLHMDPTGQHGIAALSPDGLKQTLNGVHLNIAPIAFYPWLTGVKLIEAWCDFAPVDALPVAINDDPISVLARMGTVPDPINTCIAATATAGAALATRAPGSRTFLASGAVAHEAGSTMAQELAFALASALTYAKALIAAGLSAEQAFSAIGCEIRLDQRYFEGIAKLRALRRLWANLCNAYGVDLPVHILARSSKRMLSTLDPHSNILRLTAAAFAGAVGGADAISLAPYSAALGTPDTAARRVSRNIQLVAQLESHLGAVDDPAAGSWFLEQLTEDLARAAWAEFQSIERAGGLIAALLNGDVQGKILNAAKALTRDLADKKRTIIGVTDFRLSVEPVLNFDPPPSCSLRSPPSSPPTGGKVALSPIRLSDLAAAKTPEAAQ